MLYNTNMRIDSFLILCQYKIICPEGTLINTNSKCHFVGPIAGVKLTKPLVIVSCVREPPWCHIRSKNGFFLHLQSSPVR